MKALNSAPNGTRLASSVSSTWNGCFGGHNWPDG